MCGSKVIGRPGEIGMFGFRGYGSGRRMRGRTGLIRTMTITSMAGRFMKAIGTARTMDIITITMIIMTMTTTITKGNV